MTYPNYPSVNHMASNSSVELSSAGSDHQPRLSAWSAAQSERDEPLVYIVLLNWNGWKDTVECMRSLERMAYKNWRAVVVDNGSTDDSVERLREASPELTIIETHKNLGFAAGNNVGIRLALKKAADYVFVLNNDTT